VEGRSTFLELVRKVAHTINIPFTVGGGISSIADVSALLHAGADKVSINSAAVRNPALIDELAREFGSQCIVVAIDTRFIPASEGALPEHIVHTHGGRTPTPLRTLAWAKEVEERGAGEILLTSMDTDGTKNGFALELTAAISSRANIPVIASGGAGTMDHFVEVFTTGQADAGLAASIFHFREIAIPDLKQYLQQHGIPMRMSR
jgi:cyclase